MLERGSPRAALIGRWGMALTLVTGAVLIGRLIRNFPYLLPNRLPGLVLYELGPALILVLRSAAPWSSPRKTDRALASLRGSCCLHSSRRSPGPLPLLPNMLPLSTGNGYEHEVCHVAHPYRETYMASR